MKYSVMTFVLCGIIAVHMNITQEKQQFCVSHILLLCTDMQRGVFKITKNYRFVRKIFLKADRKRKFLIQSIQNQISMTCRVHVTAIFWIFFPPAIQFLLSSTGSVGNSCPKIDHILWGCTTTLRDMFYDIQQFNFHSTNCTAHAFQAYLERFCSTWKLKIFQYMCTIQT